MFGFRKVKKIKSILLKIFDLFELKKCARNELLGAVSEPKFNKIVLTFLHSSLPWDHFYYGSPLSTGYEDHYTL